MKKKKKYKQYVGVSIWDKPPIDGKTIARPVFISNIIDDYRTSNHMMSDIMDNPTIEDLLTGVNEELDHTIELNKACRNVIKLMNVSTGCRCVAFGYK